jgi:hypothetical protein
MKGRNHMAEGMKSIVGEVVTHSKFGQGHVVFESGDTITVEFSCGKKIFAYPDSIGVYLQPTSSSFVQMAEQRKAEIQQQKEAEQAAAEAEQADTTESFERAAHAVSPTSTLKQLAGFRAQTIRFHDQDELFEVLGYMATPGRLKSIDAEVPCDGREAIFRQLFPGQKFMPITINKTPSGMPSKVGPQFRINFLNLDNCPEALKDNVGVGIGNVAGRINKSEFVLTVVQQYGFSFGDVQDVEKIRAIAKRFGHAEAFEQGFAR